METKERLSLDKREAEDAEKEARKRAREVQIAASLCTTAHFVKWLGNVLEELCALDQGYGCHDDFAQGKRAAGAFIINSLSIAGDPFVEAMTKISSEHYAQMVKKTQEGK